MTMRSKLLLPLTALSALLLPACDNPACVFGGDCFGGGGEALGSGVASLPSNGDWVIATAPKLLRFAPSGSVAVDARTPIVLFFNETLTTAGLSNAFEIVQDSLQQSLPVTAVSIADGRGVLVLPVAPLQAGESYSVAYREGAQISDRTGQALPIPSNREILDFTVADENPPEPSVVAVYPEDGDASQSATGEIVVVFDRPMDSTTVDALSFTVTADGASPASNPDPTPLSLAGGLQTDRRIYRWRSAQPLGQNKLVRLALCETLPMSDDDGNELAPVSFDYRTAAFPAPLSAALTSDPNDAIGTQALSGPADLALEVTFAGAQAGDRVGVYVFGTKPDTLEDPPLIAIAREIALVDPYDSITLTADELNLVSSQSPLKPRFAEGELAFALQLRRGTITSPITRLDVNPDQSGIQNPVLDVTPPVLLGFGNTGTNTGTLVSGERDLVVVARASESLRAAAVTTSLGDNFGGAPGVPSVAGSHSSGLFVAQPVPVGMLDPDLGALPFQLTIYDRARNATGPISASFQQRGSVGPGATTGANLSLRVFDARTLAPIVGASVYTHEDLSGLLVGVASTTTGVGGLATIKPAVFSETVLTVVAAGYELFTFDGVSSDRLDVLLEPDLEATARTSGKIRSTNPELLLYTGRVTDSRGREPDGIFQPVSSCTFQPQATSYECPYPSFDIEARQVGAQTALAYFPLPNPLLFTPEAFLKAADLVYPLPGINPGQTQTVDHTYAQLLDDAGVDALELPLEFPPQVLSTVNYPVIDGEITVSVESRSPGIVGTIPVGIGQAFSAGIPDTFAVRAAYPGAAGGFAEPDGRWVANGSIEADLFLRVRASDVPGNIGIARPRLSDASVAIDLPLPPAPGAAPIALDGSRGAYVLSFTDLHDDTRPETGLYRVVVTDADDKRWVIWTRDLPDAQGPEFRVRLPFVGPGGSFPLAAGDLFALVSLYAYPELDPSEFMYSDLERFYTRFALSSRLQLTPP
jgi:hypothetical protein